MIAAIVIATILIVLGPLILWFFSPAFRTWTEKPKFAILAHSELFEKSTMEDPMVAAPVDKGAADTKETPKDS